VDAVGCLQGFMGLVIVYSSFLVVGVVIDRVVRAGSIKVAGIMAAGCNGYDMK
jgi:hypothetical protein